MLLFVWWSVVGYQWKVFSVSLCYIAYNGVKMKFLLYSLVASPGYYYECISIALLAVILYYYGIIVFFNIMQYFSGVL